MLETPYIEHSGKCKMSICSTLLVPISLALALCQSRFFLLWVHRRSQGFCLGGGTRPMPPGRCHPTDATRPMPPSLASVVYTFEALAGSWGSVSAPTVSRIMGGAQSEKKLHNNIGEITLILGEVFLMLST